MRIPIVRHRGVSLGEVFVILFVVLVLAALILPGTQSSRINSGRGECLNNLRQLGTAMHNYHAFYERLPPAGVWDVTDPNAYGEWSDLNGIANNKLHQATMRYSWALALMPFLDQSEVYDRWEFGPPPRPAEPVGSDARGRSGFGSYWIRSTPRMIDGGNAKLADTDIRVLRCPSDPTTIQGKGNVSYLVNGGFSYHWRLDYATTGGDGRGTLLDLSDGVKQRWSENVRNSGLFFLETSDACVQSFKPPLKTSDRRSLKFADVGDGLANMVMMTENINAGPGAIWETESLPSNWACPHPWNTSFFVNGVMPTPAQGGGKMDFFAANTRGPDAPPVKPFGLQGGINGDVTGAQEGRFPYPNSGHPQAVTVLFCDGSARSVSQNIGPGTWAAMVTPNGRKFVRLSDGAIEGEPIAGASDN